MECIKLGILRETKTPPDRRVAISPLRAREIMKCYPQVKIVVQPSKIRCYSDEEFLAAGIELSEDVSDCDFLIGIKEVHIPTLISGKKYLYFAHVAKKQEYNKPLLKAIVENGITLIDYEYLTDLNGNRLIAFGRWAGVIGAYNGLRAWGLKTGRYELSPAHRCHDRREMDSNLSGLDPGLVRILVTGGGRVAGGAVETLGKLGIQEVSPADFIREPERSPVFCRIDPHHYLAHKEGHPFDFEQFCKSPGDYVSVFNRFYTSTDLLITAHYWDPASPRLWEPHEMKNPGFRIRAVADISCDIHGSVPSTIRATSIAAPFYDFDRFGFTEKEPFTDPDAITVMSIDNLPGELPRDASEEFSKVLMKKIIPCILGNDPCQILARATITRDGQLTPRFQYLESWVSGGRDT